MHIVQSVRGTGVSSLRALVPMLVSAIALFITPACTDSPPSTFLDDLDRSTLSETIDTDGDDVIDPAGLDGGIDTPPTGDAPELSIDGGQGFCCNPLTIEFRAILSDAGRFSSAGFAWEFGDGRTGTGNVVQHTYNFAGVYTVVLEATFPDGSTLVVTQSLIAGNAGPEFQDEGITPGEGDDSATTVVADAGEDFAVDAGALVTLDGSASTVSPPSAATYIWTQLDGPSITLARRNAAITSFVAPADLPLAETLTFSLIVSAGGVTDSATVSVTVLPQNPADGGDSPVVVTAHAGPDQIVEVGDLVHLSGSASNTTGPGPLSFLWSQVSGSAVTLNSPSIESPAFSAPDGLEFSQTLMFRVTVADGEVSDSDDVAITVNPVVEVDDEAEILASLTALPPLQKVHYSWAPDGYLMDSPVKPLLFEYVRITHAVTLAGRAPKVHRVDAAVRVCKAVNATNPAIPATIGIMYSPWHIVFPSDLPPTYVGPYHDEEIALFHERMLLFRQWLDEAYVEFDAVIPVTNLIFSSERFLTKEPHEEGAAEWNAAMNDKYDAFTVISNSVFPDAGIEWFGRGAIQPCRDTTRWCPKTLFTLEEMGETFNCALYIPYNVQLMIDTFRETYQNATANGVSEIMLRVSMGAAWDENRRWKMHWDYDTADSWALGAQINDPFYGDRPDEYAPWHAAPLVSFYPRPFNADTPHWGRHFVAYVKGAHGIVD